MDLMNQPLSRPQGLLSPSDWSIAHRNLRSGDVHVEGHVKVAFIRGSAGSPRGYSNQPTDRLARAEGPITVGYGNGFDVPVVAVAIRAHPIALNLDVGRLRRVLPWRAP
jgi:hypothetical protein